MLDKLLTEQRNPSSENIDTLPTEAMLRVINAADAEIPAAVAREIPRIAKVIEAVADTLSRGGRLFYIGAGTSGRLGVLDAAECPPTFNVPADLVRGIMAGGEGALVKSSEGIEDKEDHGKRDVQAAGVRLGDFLIGISASGRTPYVLGAIGEAKRMGALTGGISCSPDSELSKAVDFPMEPAPGPEVIAGSTRMRAGTATKMVLNMITTGVMIRLGYVYGNLMVNVQPTNAKLVARAQRIIRQATGVDEKRAAELLEASGRSVRIAILMEKKKIGRSEAERALAAAKGRIGEALK